METLTYESILSAASRNDVSTLLYLWTKSFSLRREGIVLRALIEKAAPELAQSLGYQNIVSFRDLVERWYWDEEKYLYAHDFRALLDLIKTSSYRVVVSAFVKYYPKEGLAFQTPLYASDIGAFIYHLCWKSEDKERTEEIVAQIAVQVFLADEENLLYIENKNTEQDSIELPFDVLTKTLFQLCAQNNNYEPFIMLCRGLFRINDGYPGELQVILESLQSLPVEQWTIVEQIIIQLLSIPNKKRFIKLLVAVLGEYRAGNRDLYTEIYDLLIKEAPDEVLFAITKQLNMNGVDFENLDEKTEYRLLREYIKSVLENPSACPNGRYWHSFLAGERSFSWFKPEFRFQRSTYIKYFGEDDVLQAMEKI